MAAIIIANTIAIATIIQIAPIIWFFACSFSWGAILVILATVCWGFENNCTRILAAKKSAHYSITPLIGTFLPFLIFQETLEWSYFLGLSIMVIGTIIVVADTLAKENQ